jgi:formamidopyrimidine-DNA glycosylase
VSGVGDVYKSEGWFAAAVDPWRAVSELDDAELGFALEALRHLMCVGLEHGRRSRKAYRRAGLLCIRCGASVRSQGQGDASRTTYWCGTCQR